MKWLISGSFLVAFISIFLSAFVFKEIRLLKIASVDKRILIQEDKVNELGLKLETMMEALDAEQLLVSSVVGIGH